MSSAPLACFQIQRNQEPIEHHPLTQTIRTGITYGRYSPNLVPLFEELQAARFAGYTLGEWNQAPSSERAQAVALYRYDRLVTLHEQSAVTQFERRRARQAREKAN